TAYHRSATIPQPPRSPLFPYTTLFRSRPRPPSPARTRRARRGRAALRPGGGRDALAPDRRRLRVPRRPAAAPGFRGQPAGAAVRSEEHTSELQSRENLVCRLLLEKKKA